MVERSVKIPGPDHPITIDNNPHRVVVIYAGRIIADTRNALRLREASYPEVSYIPRADANMAILIRSNHKTYCPFKGDCSYYNLPGDDERALNAIWTYEAPYESVAAIKDHLAFYTDRVEMIESS